MIAPLLQITEALRRYGVSDTTRSLLVVRIDGPDLPAEQAKKYMDAIIYGETVPLDKLQDITEWNTVKKVGRCVSML